MEGNRHPRSRVLAGLGTGRIHRCAVCNRGSCNAITCWIPDHRRRFIVVVVSHRLRIRPNVLSSVSTSFSLSLSVLDRSFRSYKTCITKDREEGGGGHGFGLQTVPMRDRNGITLWRSALSRRKIDCFDFVDRERHDCRSLPREIRALWSRIRGRTNRE